MSLDIRIEPFRAPPLARDYVAGSDALAPFYAGHPGDLEAYRRKADEVDRRLGAEGRSRAAQAIRTTSPASAAALERLVSEGGFFVTTGQQAGLFGGPLYTIHKILSAVRLAGALQAGLGRPVLPLFWVASDDHDWAEVRHTELLDTDNRLVRIALPEGDAEAQPPMSRRLLGPDVERAIEQLEATLPPTDFAPELLERVRRAYTPGQTVAGAFADLVADLFAPFDLLLVDAADPALKRLAAPTLRRELESGAAHEEVLRAQTERLSGAGYDAQVPILPSASNVFLDDEPAGRERLVREDGRFHLRRSGRAWDADELLALLESAPARFSPNVLLRPVVESAALPTLAYVAGPGELAYWGQIGCLFRAHEVAPPLVFPRFSALLVESKVAKVLAKLEVAPTDFAQPPHELAARVLREGLPEDVTHALAELRRAVGEGWGRLDAAARAIDPTLKGPIGSARGSAFHDIEQAEKKIVQHVKMQREVELEQLRKAGANLYPDGVPQERILNGLHYLARYGPELLARLAEAMEVRLEAHGGAWRGVECP